MKTTKVYTRNSHAKPQNVDLNSFNTISVIGKGQNSKVLLVKKKDSGDYFAMKVLKKKKVEQSKQEEHIQNERNILVEVHKNQFLIELHFSFQTKKALYFVLEYCPGGELFYLFNRNKRFSEEQTKFFAAQIVLALEFLHSKDIVYKDLKPENVLIGHDGYIKLTDFGLSRSCSKITEEKNSHGKPEYLAPEIIMKTGCGKYVDWWTLGILIYEMVEGVSPFSLKNKVHDIRSCSNLNDLFDKIKFENVKFSSNFTKNLSSFLSEILRKDYTKRLGFKRGACEIKEHAWFSNFDWKSISNKQMNPPFVPQINNDHGLSNFDMKYTQMKIDSFMEIGNDNLVQKHYDGFSWYDPGLFGGVEEESNQFESNNNFDEAFRITN